MAVEKIETVEDTISRDFAVLELTEELAPAVGDPAPRKYLLDDDSIFSDLHDSTLERHEVVTCTCWLDAYDLSCSYTPEEYSSFRGNDLLSDHGSIFSDLNDSTSSGESGNLAAYLVSDDAPDSEYQEDSVVKYEEEHSLFDLNTATFDEEADLMEYLIPDVDQSYDADHEHSARDLAQYLPPETPQRVFVEEIITTPDKRAKSKCHMMTPLLKSKSSNNPKSRNRPLPRTPTKPCQVAHVPGYLRPTKSSSRKKRPKLKSSRSQAQACA